MKHIKVVGTGNQAPYGIGEIIADFADTKAGLIKAIRKAGHWYDRPSVVLTDGSNLASDDWRWGFIRSKDKGYIDEQ